MMTIHLAHTSYDYVQTYRNARGADVAYAAPAHAIINLNNYLHLRDWHAFGSPTQTQGLFLLVAPGYWPEEVPLDAGAEPWVEMTFAEINEFVPESTARRQT